PQMVTGAKKTKPPFMGRIQARLGGTIYRHDDRPCDGCRATAWNNQGVPGIPDTREQILDPRTAYQMVSILEGVVQRGTGYVVHEVGNPLAGKPGTTTDTKDPCSVGFPPD